MALSSNFMGDGLWTGGGRLAWGAGEAGEEGESQDRHGLRTNSVILGGVQRRARFPRDRAAVLGSEARRLPSTTHTTLTTRYRTTKFDGLGVRQTARLAVLDQKTLAARLPRLMQLPWRSLPQPPFVRAVRIAPRFSATAALLTLCLLGCTAQWALHRFNAPADPLLARGALTPGNLTAGRWWTPLTHLFLASGPGWLWPTAFLTLALAGRPLESVTGRRHLWQLFGVAGITGGLGQVGFDALLHRETPVAGPGAAAMGVLLALACVSPKASLSPWDGTGALQWVKVLHGALGALIVAALAGTRSPVAGILVGGLTGCFYVQALGFARYRVPEAAAPTRARPVSSASSASWTTERLEEPVPAPVPEGLNAPAVAARNTLVVPRFTERERRMTPREFITEKVDPILEKISCHGLASLDAEERQLLDKAREKMGR